MAIEQCLVIIKPDGLIKSLTGNILSVLSETKLKIVGAKIVKVTRDFAQQHYKELLPNLIKKHGQEKGTQIFNNVLDYIQGKYHTERVFAMVYEGEEAIEKIREIAGETNPEKAPSTSIRGKYGRINSQTQVMENVIHASDSPKSAEKEIKLWFSPNELTELIYPVTTESTNVSCVVWK